MTDQKADDPKSLILHIFAATAQSKCTIFFFHLYNTQTLIRNCGNFTEYWQLCHNTCASTNHTLIIPIYTIIFKVSRETAHVSKKIGHLECAKIWQKKKMRWLVQQVGAAVKTQLCRGKKIPDSRIRLRRFSSGSGVQKTKCIFKSTARQICKNRPQFIHLSFSFIDGFWPDHWFALQVSKEAALREGVSWMHTVETEQGITALYQKLDLLNKGGL